MVASTREYFKDTEASSQAEHFEKSCQNGVLIECDELQDAIAPGQVAVLYGGIGVLALVW